MDYSTVVGFGGVALVGLNYWDGQQRADIAPLFSGASSAPNAHVAFKEIGVELVFVIVATMLSGLSDSWGMGMCAVIVALFILWAINDTTAPKGSTSSSPAPSSSAPVVSA